MARVDEWLSALKERSGSDLHLAAGAAPRMRAKGELGDLEGEAPLLDAALRALMREIVSEEQWKAFEDEGDLDFAYGIPGVARFRGNYLEQEHGAAAVFRIVPEKILTVEDLGLCGAIVSLAALQ